MRHALIDDVVADRLIAGIPVKSNRSERAIAIDYLIAERGELSARDIAKRTGVTQRTVARARARQRASA